MLGISIPLATIQSVLFIFVRILSIAMALPFFKKGVPTGFIIVFALVVAINSSLVLEPKSGVIVDSIWFFLLGCIQEIALGAIIGLICRIAFETVEMAGRIVGFQMGFALGAVMDPTSGEQDSSLSQMYNLLGVFIFFAIDGHLFLMKTLMESVKEIPPFFSTIKFENISMIFQLLSFIFILAIKISAPVLAALILSTLSMAIMARVAPQLNTFFVLLPMKILVGLLALMFSIPILGHLLKEHFGYLLGSIPQLLAKTFQ